MDESSDKNRKVILALVAHPDDAEFLCAGTLALLKKKGWSIELATMTAGDCGSRELSADEISKIRKEEARKSAELLEANYSCLDFKDIFITYDRPSLLKVIKLIRKVRPTVVLTMSPSCYMVDHEITSKLVQTACFATGMTNIKTGDTPPYFKVPHLYYLDPMEGKDKFGKTIQPEFVVDITPVIGIKVKMLKCHDSQRQWLLDHHGMDQYLVAMKQFSAQRGKITGVEFGEGFRQHLGHGYPQNNILENELRNSVHPL